MASRVSDTSPLYQDAQGDFALESLKDGQSTYIGRYKIPLDAIHEAEKRLLFDYRIIDLKTGGVFATFRGRK